MSKRIAAQQKHYYSLEDNKNYKPFPKVQQRNHHQKKSKRIEGNNYQSQNYQLPQNSDDRTDNEIDRLDLIFKKEPRDIQQKLMKLLIAYNAVMSQNKETDMFEVDLLLPFLNQEQKRQFIKQFLEVRQQKPHFGLERITDQNHNEGLEQQNDEIFSSKEFKKFSFNAHQNRPFQDEQFEAGKNNNYVSEQPSESSPTQSYQHNYYEGMGQVNAQFNPNPIVEQKQHQEDNNRLKYQEIDCVIAKRLKMAIKKIQQLKEKGKQNEYPKFGPEDNSKQEDSIIDQISNPSFNNTQNLDSKQLTFSEYIKEDQNSQSANSKDSYFQYPHSQDQNYGSLRKPYMQIQEEPDQEDQPLFKKHSEQNNNSGKNEKNKKFTSFQEYTKQIANRNDKKKLNKPKTYQKTPAQPKYKTNEVNTAKKYQSTKLNTTQHHKIKQTKNQNAKDKKPISSSNKPQIKRTNIIHPQNRERAYSTKSSHSHSHQKKNQQSPISKQSRRLKNQLQQFLQQHKKKLSKLYSQIKQRINERQKQEISHDQASQKSLQKFYILVQDDFQEFERGLEQIPEESQNSEFKQQMLKHYHNEILVNNRNLSSQELVKYFKFLHSNAKKLYIKYLQNKNK